MGQGLACYQCIWHSQCHHITGFGIALGFFSAMCCLPHEMEVMRGPGAVHCGGCDHGCGSSFFCEGYYCLIPDWLRDYSKWLSIGERRGKIYNLVISEVNPPVQGYGGQQQQFGGQIYGGNPPPQQAYRYQQSPQPQPYKNQPIY